MLLRLRRRACLAGAPCFLKKWFSRNVRLTIRRHIELPVMIDQSEANAVDPAEAPEQILIDPFIGERIHYRFEVQTECSIVTR